MVLLTLASYFSSKVSLFGNNKRIAIQYIQSNGKPCASPEEQRKETFFMDLGEAVVNEESIGGN